MYGYESSVQASLLLAARETRLEKLPLRYICSPLASRRARANTRVRTR